MNQNIDETKAGGIVALEIIVQGKGDVRQRSIGGGALKTRINQVFKGDFTHSDMGIVYDIMAVIENKRVAQGRQIQQENGTGQRQYDGGCVYKGSCFQIAKSGIKKLGA